MPMITDDEYADYIDELIKLGEAIVSAWTDMAKRLREQILRLRGTFEDVNELLSEFMNGLDLRSRERPKRPDYKQYHYYQTPPRKIIPKARSRC